MLKFRPKSVVSYSYLSFVCLKLTDSVRYDMEINTAILEGDDHDESDDDYISPLALPVRFP